MKRFDFPLERVLRWRMEQANLEELKLRGLRTERAGLEDDRLRIEAEKAGSERDVLGQTSIQPEQLERLDSYRQYVAGSVRQLEARMKSAEARIAEQLKRVMDARRQCELLDRLRGTSLTQWRTAAD